ncbi:MAG: AI-2E family transporter, partial [Chloroflexota bacterium]
MNNDGPYPVLRRALPIYYALVMALVTFFILIILWRLEHVLLILFISVLFAAALSQPAEFLTRFFIPRGLAVIIIYLLAFGFLTGIGWLVLPPVFFEAAELGNEIPSYVEEIESARRGYDELRQQYP